MEKGRRRTSSSPRESVIEDVSDELVKMEYRRKDNAQRIETNTKVHLEKIYPLDHAETENVTSYDWLFQNGKWPEKVKPFFWRYLHERSLYNVRKDNIEAIEQACQDLKQHLSLVCDVSHDGKIKIKVKRQIKYLAREWKDYGLLVQSEGLFLKAQMLEESWRPSRDEWITVIHDGKSIGLIELDVKAQSGTMSPSIVYKNSKDPRKELVSKNFGEKGATRPFPKTTPAKNDSPSRTQDPSPELSASRKRKSDSTDVSDWLPKKRKTAPKNPRKSVNHPRHQTSPDQIAHHQKIFAQQAKDLEGLQQEARSPAQTMFAEGDDSRSRYSSSRTARRETEPGTPRESEEKSAAATANSASDPDRDLFESLSQTDSLASAHRSRTTPNRLDKNGKAKLQFIFEDSKDSQDDPISTETFRNANLSEFFELVCSKALRQQGPVKCLTFRYTWGTLDAFVINRTASEEEWMSVKRKVRNKSLVAREDVRNKGIDFEIWVSCGNATTIFESGGNEDGEGEW